FSRSATRRRRLGVAWWCGALACLALLPNAAYVLTDVVHLPGAVRAEPRDSVVVAAILPMYAVLFIVGFGAYADALRRMSAFVVARKWNRSRTPIELTVHALSTLAIYIGRVHRLNSWDLVRRPVLVLERISFGLRSTTAIAGMVVTFTVL